MGIVYLAEQDQPVRRRVALKIIKPGMDTEQVIARFAAERQALAIMDHPHIAKVLDAGATDSGRPYFVMELVKGLPITDYCDEHRLEPRARLELFIPVCRALQHAHQKGIIHRDIKPSNVLVALVDGHPVPKVIDFGVAKAIDQRLAERTIYTQLGAVVGTLEYMSPEQAGASPLDVDTRSDVYSLGVLLYELLTGTTPLERERLCAAGYEEVVRRIKEEEPPKPSTRLSGSGERLPAIAARRGVEPARLSRLVRGELDWIAMRALEKDRTRRYETAGALARDVERYLEGEAVEAGPPSALYRLRKFARKHRAALATAGAVAGLLLMAAAISTLLAIRATRAGRQALADRNRAVIAEAEARRDRDAAITAGQAEARVRRRAEEAERDSRIETDKALAINRFLTDDLLSQAEPEHNAADSKVTLLEVLDRAAAKVGDRFGDQPDLEVALRRTIAGTYHGLGAFDKSERHFRVAAEIQRRRSGPESAETWQTLSDIGHMIHHLGRDPEAVDLLEKASKGLRRTLGPDHPTTLTSMSHLATAHWSAGRPGEAVALHEETLKFLRARLGPDHRETLINMGSLASAYRLSGRLGAALPLYEETLKLMRARLGPDHPETLIIMNNLASTYRFVGRLSEAVPLFEETLKLNKARLGLEHPSTLSTMNNLASAYRAAGRLSEAVPLFEETLRLNKARLGPEHPNTLNTMNNLVGAYLDASRWADAERTAHEWLGLRATKPPGDWWRYRTMSLLGAALAGQKKYAEAEPLLLRGYEGLNARAATIPAQRRNSLAEAASRIVGFYAAWGKPGEAAAWRAKLHPPPADLPADVFAP
jgi:tetratricopeptide (TPR) repeat protein/tRNA A-37 threonylcarbamoyl transferase component Bud32